MAPFEKFSAWNCRTFSASLIPHKWQTDLCLAVSMSVPHDGFNIDRRATTFTNLNYNQSHMLCGVVVLALSQMPTGEQGEGEGKTCVFSGQNACWLENYNNDKSRSQSFGLK